MLDNKILELAKEQTKLGGIDVSKLKSGTKILVETENSKYDITVLENRKILICGGNFFQKPIECYFNGSTFGGTMIKINWIGYEMHMEIVTKEGRIQTSQVKNAKIYGDNWQYELNWQNK